MSNSDNVRTVVTYKVSVGPTTSDAPTSSASALDTDLVDLGYVGSDGVNIPLEQSTTDIKDLAGQTVRTVMNDAKITFTFELIETNADVLETYWAAETAGATSTDGRLDIVPTATGGRKSWVLDFADGTKATRYYLPSAEVTARGGVTHKAGEETGYQLTLTAYPVSGVSVKLWDTALKTA